MIQRSKQKELYWASLVMRKWLNIPAGESDYSADSDEDDDLADADSDDEGFDPRRRESNLRVKNEEDARFDPNGVSDARPILRRRNSETFRAQYIDKKDIRICVGTWNVGGKVPPDELDIDDWIDTTEPADIYVLGLQEVVPLNASNIFGAEDNRPVSKWEDIVRDALNRIRPKKSKIKSYSDPPSPSKFKPSEDIPDIEEELPLESDSDAGEEIHPYTEESNKCSELAVIGEDLLVETGVSDSTDDSKFYPPMQQNLLTEFSSPKTLESLFSLRVDDLSTNAEAPASQGSGKLNRWLSGSERIGLSWPEPPLSLLNQHGRPASFKSIKSFSSSKYFQTYSSFKSIANQASSDISLLAELDLASLARLKRGPSYVRIASKQMVGIFLTIWVRKSLRKHIQNLRVSTVGVGALGYIGNKGSVSVSLSIHQTLFCFICTHLTSGEKDGDEIKRNADVHEILRRTHFHSFSAMGVPRSIHDHDKIIWLGDLNYRIDSSFEKTCELIARKEWHSLVEKDQLVREMNRGRAFEGWFEGSLSFPPTYKYEINSEKYCGEDPKAEKRTPAWCDRVISYGNGMKLLSYRRTELKLSDHRPVTATYMAEVEVFSPRKLQRALTFTNAEIETRETTEDI